jgi:hypothetical protein
MASEEKATGRHFLSSYAVISEKNEVNILISTFFYCTESSYQVKTKMPFSILAKMINVAKIVIPRKVPFSSSEHILFREYYAEVILTFPFAKI